MHLQVDLAEGAAAAAAAVPESGPGVALGGDRGAGAPAAREAAVPGVEAAVPAVDDRAAGAPGAVPGAEVGVARTALGSRATPRPVQD